VDPTGGDPAAARALEAAIYTHADAGSVKDVQDACQRWWTIYTPMSRPRRKGVRTMRVLSEAAYLLVAEMYANNVV
jgi:hypothetical protein